MPTQNVTKANNCDVCSKSFKSKQILKVHMEKFHGISSKPKKEDDDINESNNTTTDMVFVPPNGAMVPQVIPIKKKKYPNILLKNPTPKWSNGLLKSIEDEKKTDEMMSQNIVPAIVHEVIPAAEQVKKIKYSAPKFTKVLVKSTYDKRKTGEMMKSMSQDIVPVVVPKMIPAYLPAMVPKMIPAGNQSYTTTQYSGNQKNGQDHQGCNNIGYENYSNHGYVPNDIHFAENQGYQNPHGSNQRYAQNNVQPAETPGYQNAQYDLGNYYFQIPHH